VVSFPKGSNARARAYTGGGVPRAHYSLLCVALLCAPLFLAAAAGSAEVTIDPALARGPADAPVTIVEFSDYQCPSCNRAQPALGQAMKEFEGMVRLVHKDYPSPLHPGARPAAEAARCAAAQGVFWEYHDMLYLAVPDFSRDDLLRYAERLSLDGQAFATCLDTRQFRSQIDADVREARALKLPGTPSFLVNGKPLIGAQPIDAWRQAIREALKDSGAR